MIKSTWASCVSRLLYFLSVFKFQSRGKFPFSLILTARRNNCTSIAATFDRGSFLCKDKLCMSACMCASVYVCPRLLKIPFDFDSPHKYYIRNLARALNRARQPVLPANYRSTVNDLWFVVTSCPRDYVMRITHWSETCNLQVGLCDLRNSVIGASRFAHVRDGNLNLYLPLSRKVARDALGSNDVTLSAPLSTL